MRTQSKPAGEGPYDDFRMLSSLRRQIELLFATPLPPGETFGLALQASQRVPPWAPLIQSVLQDPTGFSLIGQSPAAMVVVRQDSKTFVLTFGHAWAKLDDDWLGPDFGRRVALNLIAPS